MSSPSKTHINPLCPDKRPERQNRVAMAWQRFHVCLAGRNSRSTKASGSGGGATDDIQQRQQIWALRRCAHACACVYACWMRANVSPESPSVSKWAPEHMKLRALQRRCLQLCSAYQPMRCLLNRCLAMLRLLDQCAHPLSADHMHLLQDAVETCFLHEGPLRLRSPGHKILEA
eukprot:514495-Pelagomonas_calceolata.AAC.5